MSIKIILFIISLYESVRSSNKKTSGAKEITIHFLVFASELNSYTHVSSLELIIHGKRYNIYSCLSLHVTKNKNRAQKCKKFPKKILRWLILMLHLLGPLRSWQELKQLETLEANIFFKLWFQVAACNIKGNLTLNLSQFLKLYPLWTKFVKWISLLKGASTLRLKLGPLVSSSHLWSFHTEEMSPVTHTYCLPAVWASALFDPAGLWFSCCYAPRLALAW